MSPLASSASTASMTIAWWKTATVYQIYPQSYLDSNGDGVGDFPGITSKLDYIKSLGVDVIWVCPHYKSPQVDMGYDVSDYEDVYEGYGTLQDAQTFIDESHKRGLRVIFDLVVNHTSDQHAWFKESRSSKTNPKADWYMWKDAKYVDGKRMPPNNWKAHFGGSAWEWCEEREQYYLHYFAVEQPDLNWELEEVRQAIYKTAILFWLERGVDGFRVDTSNMYSKNLEFPDADIVDPDNFEQPATKYYSNGPRIHEFLQEMNRETFAKYDAMTVGEAPHIFSVDVLAPFVSAARKEFDMVFEFDIAEMDCGKAPLHRMRRDWKISDFKKSTAKSQSYIDGTDLWITAYLENHDRSRMVTRFGDDSPEFRGPTAKMLATYLLTLSGTIFMHQGGEIGMINAPKTWSIEDYRDLDAIQWHAEQAKRGDDAWTKKVLDDLQHLSRDHGRLPMQWDNSKNAGFTTGTPWLRVHDEYEVLNVAEQEKDQNSVLNYYRALIALRKRHPALALGHFELLDPESETTMCYTKEYLQEKLLVLLNFSKESQRVDIPDGARLLIGTEASAKSLSAYEARVYLLS
ncbi:hypothetical protein PYCC9005_005889 [Savitreella phatthalungensis]